MLDDEMRYGHCRHSIESSAPWNGKTESIGVEIATPMLHCFMSTCPKTRGLFAGANYDFFAA